MNLKLLHFLFYSLIFLEVYGQNKIYKANLIQVEKFNLYVRELCDSIQSTATNSKLIAKDKKNIKSLNQVYNSVRSYDNFLKVAKIATIAHKDSVNLGIVKFRNFSFYKTAGYLKIDVSLAICDDIIVYKKINIETTSKLKCISKDEQLSWLFDYHYWNSSLIKLAEIQFRGCPTCPTMSSDTLDQSQFVFLNKKYPAYKFRPVNESNNIKDTELFLELTYKTIIAYSETDVDSRIRDLVIGKNYQLLKELLFCPNNSVSVNAYEALIYLKNKELIEFNPEIESKFTEIQRNAVPLLVNCGKDCVTTKPSYKSLNITNISILNKYENSVHSGK